MSQDNNQIAVRPRGEFGNNASRRARRQGLIPAVIYAKGQETKAIYVEAGEWESISKHHHHIVYLLDGDDKQAALVREVQFNHLKNHFVHIDFQKVDAGELIHSTINLHGVGQSVGVAHGGVMEQPVHELAVECRPDALIDVINVDISALDIGGSICVKDISVPAGVKVLANAEMVVFHVARPKLETEPAAEATEATEPEAIKEKKKEEA